MTFITPFFTARIALACCQTGLEVGALDPVRAALLTLADTLKLALRIGIAIFEHQTLLAA